MNIQDLICDNKTNHYKLLTIVGDDPAKEDQIINHLKFHGWLVFDVEEIILELIKDVSEDEIKLSISYLIKKWVKTVGNRLVLKNANILYSAEMDQIGPFDAFKYLMRGEKEGILFLNARLKENRAIYSKPDRIDYSERELTDVLYVPIEDVTIQED